MKKCPDPRSVCVSFCQHTLGEGHGAALPILPAGGQGGGGLGWHGPLAWAEPALGTGRGGKECKLWQEGVLPHAGPTNHDLAGEEGQAGSPRPPASAWRGAAGGARPRHTSILPAPGGFPHPQSKICRLSG